MDANREQVRSGGPAAEWPEADSLATEGHGWSPASWRSRSAEQLPSYPDPAALAGVEAELAAAPPLAAIGDMIALKAALAEVAVGRAFLLQGGDCAESFADFSPAKVRMTLTLLLRMGAMLAAESGQAVVHLARIAGQFAKPRTALNERIGEVTLPSYRGDAVNGADFTPASRTPDPARLLDAYRQAQRTIALLEAEAPEILPTFTSHEALLLWYEQALTRRDAARQAWWATSGHMVWIGDRTRALDGAHVEYARGIANPIGLKCGPTLGADELLRLIDRLDPANEPGRLVLIGRFGAEQVGCHLPALMQATRGQGRNAIWSIDPMHGNTRAAGTRKTRLLADILAEIGAFFEIAASEGVHAGGMHLEMTGEDVTECLGGSISLSEEDLSRRYLTYCDPRLNQGQALDVAAFAATLLRQVSAEGANKADAPRLPRDEQRLTAWPAPVDTIGMRGIIRVPGDKSMSHRALILGALAEGRTKIEGLLEGEDVLRTVDALRGFGIEVEQLAPGHWRVTGAPWRSPAAPIDCGNSGTAARLLMGAAAGFPIEAVFTGDASLRERPMDRALDPLRQMGAKAEAAPGDRLPARIRGGGLGGISYLNRLASAQVKSTILLAGLNADGPVEIVEPLPTRGHSEKMLRLFGCEVETKPGRVRLGARRKLAGTQVRIPGDPSSAAYPIVAALIVPGSEVRIERVLTSPLRVGLLQSLREMGAEIHIEDEHVEGGELVANILVCSGRGLSGIDVPAERVPTMIDEYPILAVAAACARGRTRLHGLAELRVKESDRFAAIVDGLCACGVAAASEDDTIVIDGSGSPPPGGARIVTGGDHRIAMSFLVLGLGSRAPVEVDGAPMIATSFPGFVEIMRAIGARIA
jgi:3-phosphoshikimate 1-carboxyvinyltransferase